MPLPSSSDSPSSEPRKAGAGEPMAGEPAFDIVPVDLKAALEDQGVHVPPAVEERGVPLHGAREETGHSIGFELVLDAELFKLRNRLMGAHSSAVPGCTAERSQQVTARTTARTSKAVPGCTAERSQQVTAITTARTSKASVQAAEARETRGSTTSADSTAVAPSLAGRILKVVQPRQSLFQVDSQEGEGGASKENGATTKSWSHHAMTKRQARLVEAVKSSAISEQMPVRKENFCQRLAGDKHLMTLVLDSAMGIVIVLNCITIGVSSDYAVDWFGWIVIDTVFATVFLTELLLQTRILGWKEYFVGVEWKWHIFEVALVVLAWLEVILAIMQPAGSEDNSANNFSLFRIMRLVRITRLLRVCRFEIFCDLIIMVKGTLGGLKTLLWSTVLILLPLYAVSLLFRETLGHLHYLGNGAESFRTLPMSMFTVFRCIVTGECTDTKGRPMFSLIVNAYGWGYGVIYCAVEVFMTFGLFNVIVAIFVENVLAGAKTNDQLMRRQRLRDESFWGIKMLEMSTLVWETHRQMFGRKSQEALTAQTILKEARAIQITPDLFEELRHSEAFADILKDLDVSEMDSEFLFDTLDADVSGSIDMEELLVGIEKLRGDARRSDIVSVSLKISAMVSQFNSQFTEFSESLDRVQRYLQALNSRISSEFGVGEGKAALRLSKM